MTNETWEDFAAQLFEYEYCSECGGDSDDHIGCIDPFGNWFAMCKWSPIVAGYWIRHGRIIKNGKDSW